MKKELLTQYEAMLEALIVMDDYDGGKAEMLRTVIKDLKQNPTDHEGDVVARGRANWANLTTKLED